MSTAIFSPKPGNLPNPLSSFIGRELEIVEVTRLLSEQRVISFVGSGGCGKTRLALQIARKAVAKDYPEGVWWVDFAPLSDPALIAATVASVLGVHEQGGTPLPEALASWLHSKKCLLILDNCEHLVKACAELTAGLLEKCPRLRLLATSREPLGISGEVVWTVQPLSLPGPQPWRSPDSEREAFAVYQQSEAVQLFAARAAMVAPDFQLTPQNGPWVSDICRRLDGMPLAIELAAARARALSVRQIAERLDQRFDLLTGGLRTAPPRQKTLEAALDWSYTLLSESEQLILQRLAVFMGGWTLEAAEAICAGEGLEPAAVMGLVANLVDKSMVEVEQSQDENRYRLLETIRQYALMKLRHTGQEVEVRDRHLRYYTGWAGQYSPELRGSKQISWLSRFDVEHDNVRVALEWSQRDEIGAELGVQLAGAVGPYWGMRSLLSEGRVHLAAALNHYGPQHHDAQRAHALQVAAWLAYLQSDYPATHMLAEELLNLWREIEPEGLGMAGALDTLGELATEEGDYESALAYFEEALRIYRLLNDSRGTGDMLLQLGWAAMRTGDYEHAASLLNESLTIFRAIGEHYLCSLTLSGLGELAVRQGHLGRAVSFLEESLSMRRSIGHRWGIATSLGSLAWAALLQGDLPRMQDRLRESLEIRMEIGDRGGIAWCLEKLAEADILLAKNTSHSRRSELLHHATGLYGAAAGLRTEISSVIDPADQPEYEKNLAWLENVLGNQAFQQAWDKGKAIPQDNLLFFALVELPEDITGSLTDGEQGANKRAGRLSPREQEAAALIAQGLSNREIARRMVVRVKTVETYVTRILNKLGFDSRVQIATWAVEKGLFTPEAGDPGPASSR